MTSIAGGRNIKPEDIPVSPTQQPRPQMKSCPFCGSSDKLEPDEAGGVSADGKPTLNSGCESCGALGPMITLEPHQHDEQRRPTEWAIRTAIEAWNRRPEESRRQMIKRKQYGSSKDV